MAAGFWGMYGFQFCHSLSALLGFLSEQCLS